MTPSPMTPSPMTPSPTAARGDQSHPGGRLARIRRRIARLLFVAVWVVVMVLVALGSAGLIASLDHPPGSPARQELTWVGDSALAPKLATGRTQLEEIGGQLDRLGTLARGSLAAAIADKTATVDQAIADGTALVGQIDLETDLLTAGLLALPGVGPNPDLHLSRPTQETLHLMVDALDSTRTLSSDWVALTKGTIDASRLTGLLDQHDKLIVSAIDAAIGRKFKTAIARIDRAAAKLKEAGTIRDTLRARTDVATLSEWLRRNENYDVALRRLYIISARSPVVITQAMRNALAAEKRARDALPRDRSALVIIVSELSRGGLNQAVIRIEMARNDVADGLAALDEQETSASAP
jgi:hypothetical protein